MPNSYGDDTSHIGLCWFSYFLVGLRYIHIFNSFCRIQGLEICICETYPFALFYLVAELRKERDNYLVTESRKERDRDIDGRLDVDGI